ncbi:MAG: Gfo/Idh/MocA family oxidoreductase [Planctomycetes bacterium]|nr:Gfo/Idh/MocA family oxidoreductase [Planctomycetota bacterium]
MPMHRRDFLAGAAAGAAAFTVAPLRAMAPRARPAERLGLGLIGAGDLGYGHHLPKLQSMGAFDVVGFADPDQQHLDRAVQRAGGKAKGYRDYRRLLDHRDIDVVLIASPDHWHALHAVHACEAPKDVYCEKPLSLTIADGRAISDAARRHRRVFQTGTQQRSSSQFRHACELVQNGKLGTLQEVDVCIGPGPTSAWHPDSAPPPHLDWDLWLGPAPLRPYNERRCHYQFRWFYEYSGGKLTDWGAHHIDIAQWGLGTELSGPVAVEATGVHPADNFFETATEFDVRYTYPGGLVVKVHGAGENGVTFRGSQGSVFVSRGTIRSEPKVFLDSKAGTMPIVLPESRDHHGDWLDCLRSRRDPISNVEASHRSATVCHLGNVAMRLGRRLQWNPATEEFVGDDAANRMRSRPMRGEWRY